MANRTSSSLWFPKSTKTRAVLGCAIPHRDKAPTPLGPEGQLDLAEALNRYPYPPRPLSSSPVYPGLAILHQLRSWQKSGNKFNAQNVKALFATTAATAATVPPYVSMLANWEVSLTVSSSSSSSFSSSSSSSASSSLYPNGPVVVSLLRIPKPGPASDRLPPHCQQFVDRDLASPAGGPTNRNHIIRIIFFNR